jgi:hypothetical protein
VKLTTHLHLEPRSRMPRAIPPLPNMPSWCGAQLKHRDNFTVTFYLVAQWLTQENIFSGLSSSKSILKENESLMHLVGLLGRGICPPHGVCLYRETYKRKTVTSRKQEFICPWVPPPPPPPPPPPKWRPVGESAPFV